MKNILKFTSTFACCFVLATAPLFTGCETIKKVYQASTITVSAPTTAQLVDVAEKTAMIGKDAMDTFLRLDEKHREAYRRLSPKISEFSVCLREQIPDPTIITPGDPPIKLIPRGISHLKILRKATRTFEAERTPENEANLRTALKTLQSLIDDVKNHTQQALRIAQ